MDRYADLEGLEHVARTVMRYDERNQLTDLTHKTVDDVLADYDLDWDAAGQLTDFDFTSLVGNDGNTDYDYDASGQLIDADSSFQDDETYVYDDNGNRTSTTIGTTGATYATGDHNRITSDGTHKYTYDNEGNITLKHTDSNDDGIVDSGEPTVEYEWDHRNRLTKVTLTDASGTKTVVEYTYDFGNRWVRKTLDVGDNGVDSSRIFVHDNGQIVLDFEDGSLAHRYLWGQTTDQLLADETIGDETLWALGDHQNSVRDLVDSSGNVDKHVTYDAYGNVKTDTAPTVASLFLYTARPFDQDTTLQNNLNRWYDANIGRWISTDPIGFEAGDANLYRYVGNSPFNFIDPNGLNGGLSGVDDPILELTPIDKIFGPPSGWPIDWPGLIDPIIIRPDPINGGIKDPLLGSHYIEFTGLACGSIFDSWLAHESVHAMGKFNYNWDFSHAGEVSLLDKLQLKWFVDAQLEANFEYEFKGFATQQFGLSGFKQRVWHEYKFSGNAFGSGLAGALLEYQSDNLNFDVNFVGSSYYYGNLKPDCSWHTSHAKAFWQIGGSGSYKFFHRNQSGRYISLEVTAEGFINDSGAACGECGLFFNVFQ